MREDNFLYQVDLLRSYMIFIFLCKSAGRASHTLFPLYKGLLYTFVLLVKSFLSLTLFALLRVMFVVCVHLFSAMELWEKNYFSYVSFTPKLKIFDTIFFLKQFQVTSIFRYYTVFNPSDCLLLNVIYFAYPVSRA